MESVQHGDEAAPAGSSLTVMGSRDEAALVASLVSLKRSQDGVTAPAESSLDELCAGTRVEAAPAEYSASLKNPQDGNEAVPFESSSDETSGCTRFEAALAGVAKDPMTGNEAVPAEPSAAPGEPTEGWILAVDYQSVDEPG